MTTHNQFSFMENASAAAIDPQDRNGMVDWKVRALTPAWEIGSKSVKVKIERGGFARGLFLSKHSFGVLDYTTKSLSKIGIGPGYSVELINDQPVRSILGLSSNEKLRKHIQLLKKNSTISFKPPPDSEEWRPFNAGTKWVRLFTDGGQSDPDNPQGEASYGFVIVIGPFMEHNPSRITEADGTVIHRG